MGQETKTMNQVVQMVSDVHFGTRGVKLMSNEETFYFLEKMELERRYELLKMARDDHQREVSREIYVDVLTDNARKYKQLAMDYMAFK